MTALIGRTRSGVALVGWILLSSCASGQAAPPESALQPPLRDRLPATSAIDFQPPPPMDSTLCADRPVGVAIIGAMDPEDHRAWFDSTGIDLSDPAFELLAEEELPQVLNANEILRLIEAASMQAIRSGFEGGAPRVGLHIDSHGGLLGYSLVSTSGSADMDRAALLATSRMKLASALKDGCPVESWVAMPVTVQIFRIGGGRGGGG